ncbi:hypothetical protein ACHAW5_009100 [Stephanodiscus triporus]|uniref:Uncharacterized protein n=1 Tax=Stephanodiscus triporus TaxID=2934178 RepID=A0ABD3P6E4_9STRA
MGDEDSDDEADFLLVNWDLNGDAESAGSQSEGEDAIIIFNNNVDSSKGGGERCGTPKDIHSVVRRIGSPFLCQRTCNMEVNVLKHQSKIIPDERSTEARKNACIMCNIIDMRQRMNAIKNHMGTMAQCRGSSGDALREAGSICALLTVLWRLVVQSNGDDSETTALLPQMAYSDDGANFVSKILCGNHLHLRNDGPSFDGIVANEFDMTALDLATSCLGSLRDLSCGSASNRAAVLAWTPPSSCKAACIENGVHLLSNYVKRYDQWKWEEILALEQRGPDTRNSGAANECVASTHRGKKELRLLTNALGAIRNTSHSTPDVCQEMFDHGLVDPLVWRLMPRCLTKNRQSTTIVSSLPDVSLPWREACFRAAGSLINLAEKCPDVAHQLGSDRELIHLLIETWGGASAMAFDQAKTSARALPLLHLGLVAILNAAADGALAEGLDEVMVHVLENEKMRKRVAQRREDERKLGQIKHIIL